MNLISIIVPVFNEVQSLPALTAHLNVFSHLENCELILVDGGSVDNTLENLQRWQNQNQQAKVRIISSEKGRAMQMNAGAHVASGNILLFLHADTFLPASFPGCITQQVRSDDFWGRFNVQLNNPSAWAKVISFFINHRSRLTSIATGDQALFFTRELYEKLGGFPQQALMEDIEMSKCANKYCKPICLKDAVQTSARRWEKHGVIKTVLLMWWLRIRYFFGAAPDELHQQYYK